jgi:hypothetical protein
MNNKLLSYVGAAGVALFAAQTLAAAGLTVLTVPWDPTTPTTPHTTYPINSTTEATIILVATVPSAVGSNDSFTYSWNFGDGTSSAAAPVSNPYDLSVTHQYPASAATGTQWTATVTVKDTTNSTSGSAKYYVIQGDNNLTSRVNVATDWGLSYMHRTMFRGTTTVGSNTVPWGGWDTGCNAVNGNTWDCTGYGAINAENVQAFEVWGHLASGPSTDPYTDDVARGTNRMFYFLVTETPGPTKYLYNPATVNYTCKDGTYPGTTPYGTSDPLCTTHGGQLFYNPTASSCTSPPCSFTFDGNNNNQLVHDSYGSPIYTTSPYMDALIAAGTPNATAQVGAPGILGATYKTLVQDMLDFYAYSQYYDDYDLGNPANGYSSYYRGGGFSASGGGWIYTSQGGDDNSTSQWAAIGLISAERGLGLTVPQVVKDMNNVWITNAQDAQSGVPTGPDSYAANDNKGAFGYRGALYYSNAWGPFAVTPSGLVQMALDGVGRTTNTAFGDSATAADQRWNTTETFYADNFCNDVTKGAASAPRDYVYGLFSFTKAMLLHSPGGVLSPIQYLRTETPNVFTGNPSVPADTIDWYAAVSTANGGQDPCDGVAQTLVNYQLNPPDGVFDGHWYGNNYEGEGQDNFETAWALIMLKRTVFVNCINNLTGAGSSTGASPARIDLSWTNQVGSTSYTVLRSSTNGSGYVAIGTTNNTSFSDPLNDKSGVPALVNGDTYYYVVQPDNGNTAVCQSNQATITVPKLSGRH